MTGNSNSRRLPEKRAFGRLDASALGRVVNRAELGKVTTALEQRLDDLGMDGFTEPAAAALAESQTTHFRQLGDESISIAKGAGLDAVSRDHVLRAVNKLRRADSPTWKAILNIVGGALLGTAVQEIVGIVNSSGPLDKTRVLITMGLAVASVTAICAAVVTWRRN